MDWDWWQKKILQRVYDCQEKDESPRQKDCTVTLVLVMHFSTNSRELQSSSSPFIFVFPFLLTILMFLFCYRDINSVLLFLFLTALWIFLLIFNDVNICFRDQNVFRLVIGNVIFFQNPVFRIQSLFLNRLSIHQFHLPSHFSLYLAMQMFFISSLLINFHVLFLSCYLNPFLIIITAESCELMSFYIWFPWCIAYFDPNFLYILHIWVFCVYFTMLTSSSFWA